MAGPGARSRTRPTTARMPWRPRSSPSRSAGVSAPTKGPVDHEKHGKSRWVDSTIATKVRIEVRGGTLTVAKGTGQRKQVEIGAEPMVVGRNESCDLVLEDRKVSAVHLELVATERGVRVRDLGSRNGAFIGDTRIGEVFITKQVTIAL